MGAKEIQELIESFKNNPRHNTHPRYIKTIECLEELLKYKISKKRFFYIGYKVINMSRDIHNGCCYLECAKHPSLIDMRKCVAGNQFDYQDVIITFIHEISQKDFLESYPNDTKYN